jgi:DNA-binding NtrC family response regulator
VEVIEVPRGEAPVAEYVEAVDVGGAEEAEARGKAPPESVVLYRTGMRMEEVERAAIEAALRDTRGNRRKAAEMLGIGERTLYRKLKEYELEVEEQRHEPSGCT